MVRPAPLKQTGWASKALGWTGSTEAAAGSKRLPTALAVPRRSSTIFACHRTTTLTEAKSGQCLRKQDPPPLACREPALRTLLGWLRLSLTNGAGGGLTHQCPSIPPSLHPSSRSSRLLHTVAADVRAADDVITFKGRGVPRASASATAAPALPAFIGMSSWARCTLTRTRLRSSVSVCVEKRACFNARGAYLSHHRY